MVTTSAAVAAIESVFTEPQRLALAGCLAGYTGLTREAWRTRWTCASTPAGASSITSACSRPGAPTSSASPVTSKPGVDHARQSPAGFCTVAGFYRYAVEEELLDHSPAAHVRCPRLDCESHAAGLDRNELGAMFVAAGLSQPADHALISLLALNACGSPRPPAPTSRPWARSAGAGR